MPLPERVIVPVGVCRGTLQLPVPDELEGVTNGSLANIIRQLSTLSRHAEEMFGNLFSEAEVLAGRGSNLQARIDKLAVKVTQLDSNVEEVTLQEIQLRRAFRSTQIFDQQVVSRDTMPKSMVEQYLACDKPPPLDKLNPYREDGKDGLKFYTDANYFFDLWRSEMLQSTQKAEKGRRGGLKGSRPEGGTRHKKRVRQPHNTAERQRQKALNDGEYIMGESGGLGVDGGGGGRSGGYSVHFNLPGEPNGYGMVPGGYEPADYGGSPHRPTSIDIQGMGQFPEQQQGGRYNGGPGGGRVVRFEDTSRQYTQEPIYTPRVLREPDRVVQFDLSHTSYIPDSPTGGQNSDSSRSATPQRRPSNPPPAPPPVTTAAASQQQLPVSLNIITTNGGGGGGGGGGTPTRGGRAGSAGRDSLPPPPPPPANELQVLTLNGLETGDSSLSHDPASTVGGLLPHQTDPELPPPPPVPDTLNTPARLPPAHHLAPSPPPPPAPGTAPLTAVDPPAATGGVPAPPPPPPPPPPMENGGPPPINGMINNSPMKAVLNSITSGPPQLKKAQQIVRNPKEDVRSDLLKAIRDGISLKKVEQKEAADQSQAAGLSDVASILARRVALEVSDSDEGPSDSEYDSDDWGETDA